VAKELEGISFVSCQDYPELKEWIDAIKFIALATDGFSGAGVIAVCNEAKLLASKSCFKNQMRDPFLTAEMINQAIEAQRPGKNL
jgi:ATP-dependent Zn protease